MNLSVSFHNQLVHFDFSLDEQDESLLENKVHIGNRSCFFELPEKVSESDIHPDLLALSAVLSVFPFIAKELNLSFAVSRQFSDSFLDSTNIKIGPIDSNIKPRHVKSGRPGLAYSAGVDSTAALAIMPENTVVCFLDRVIPSFKKSMYNKSAAMKTMADVSGKGFESYSIASNMEYMRSPVGFPVSGHHIHNDIPFSSAIPILLMADKLKIDAVAFGIVLESIYLVGHKRYDNFSQSSTYLRWNDVFKAVGCDLYLATAGLSEVATSIITEKFAVSQYARSCMRGSENNPCKKCIKCFRKLTLDKALVRKGVILKDLFKNLQNREVLRNLYSTIKHENVYRYIVEHLEQNEFTSFFSKKVKIDGEDTTWMERWYSKSGELIPPKYLNQYKRKINQYIEPMNDYDTTFVEQWGVNFRSNSRLADTFEWQDYLSSKLEDESTKKFFEDLLKKQSLPLMSKEVPFMEWKKSQSIT